MEDTKLRAVEQNDGPTQEEPTDPEDLMFHRIMKSLETGDTQGVIKISVSMIQQGLALMSKGRNEYQNDLLNSLTGILDIMSLNCLITHVNQDERVKSCVDSLRLRILEQTELRAKKKTESP